jgi:hypothetical protein
MYFQTALLTCKITFFPQGGSLPPGTPTHVPRSGNRRRGSCSILKCVQHEVENLSCMRINYTHASLKVFFMLGYNYNFLYTIMAIRLMLRQIFVYKQCANSIFCSQALPPLHTCTDLAPACTRCTCRGILTWHAYLSLPGCKCCMSFVF